MPFSRGLLCPGTKGRVSQGKTPPSHKLNIQLVKRKELRSFLLLESNCKQRLLLMWFKHRRAHPKLAVKLNSVLCGTGFRGMEDERMKGILLHDLGQPLKQDNMWKRNPFQAVRSHHVKVNPGL